MRSESERAMQVHCEQLFFVVDVLSIVDFLSSSLSQ